MRRALLYILFFFIAFIPRIWDCQKHINCDGAKYWFGRCTRFIKALEEGDLTSTFQAPHPGVTLMWPSGSSLYLFEKYGFVSNIHRIFAAKLPIITITLFCVLFFHLVEKIFKKKAVAALTFLFVTFEPHFLAHCREFQLDALLASSMSLSLLFSIYFLQSRGFLYLCLAALFCALAILTKLPALLLLPILFCSFYIHSGGGRDI
jgi:hypothetical protein